MEYKRRFETGRPESHSSEKPKKKSGFRNFLNELCKTLSGREFIESAQAIISHLSGIDGLEMAVVTMDVYEKSFGYEVVFSSIYSKNGIPFQTKNFHVIETSADDIPAYLVEAVARDGGKTTITFSKEDLMDYFAERDADIETETTYKSIIDTWEKSGCEGISFTDRVFYTRVDFYSQPDRVVRSYYVGRISDMPEDVYEKIYPFKSAFSSKTEEEI